MLDMIDKLLIDLFLIWTTPLKRKPSINLKLSNIFWNSATFYSEFQTSLILVLSLSFHCSFSLTLSFFILSLAVFHLLFIFIFHLFSFFLLFYSLFHLSFPFSIFSQFAVSFISSPSPLCLFPSSPFFYFLHPMGHQLLNYQVSFYRFLSPSSSSWAENQKGVITIQQCSV